MSQVESIRASLKKALLAVKKFAELESLSAAWEKCRSANEKEKVTSADHFNLLPALP